MPRSLSEYERKRDFSRTGEPQGKSKTKGISGQSGSPQYRTPEATMSCGASSTQMPGGMVTFHGRRTTLSHNCQATHRPSRRMRTEDHPLEYLEWEGVIPKGEYGAGPMIVWDRGVFQNISETRQGEPMELPEAIEKGDVKIFMLGEKIKGAYALVRTSDPGEREKWLLIKKKDEGADARRRPTSSQPESVLSGRTIEDLLAGGSDGS